MQFLALLCNGAGWERSYQFLRAAGAPVRRRRGRGPPRHAKIDLFLLARTFRENIFEAKASRKPCENPAKTLRKPGENLAKTWRKPCESIAKTSRKPRPGNEPRTPSLHYVLSDPTAFRQPWNGAFDALKTKRTSKSFQRCDRADARFMDTSTQIS